MKSIVLLSGGIDSVTLLYWVLTNTNDEVVPLFFDYGQSQCNEERKAAEHICTSLGLSLTTMKIGVLECTKGDYIPSRNSILIMTAGHLAEKIGAGQIYYGAIKAERVYVDCSVDYISKMNEVLALSNIKLIAPFVENTKAEVIGLMLEYDIDIDSTFSCNYSSKKIFGGRKVCGICNDCIIREETKKIIEEYNSNHS